MIERLRSWLRLWPIGTPVSEPETTSYDPRLEHPEPSMEFIEAGAVIRVGDRLYFPPYSGWVEIGFESPK